MKSKKFVFCHADTFFNIDYNCQEGKKMSNREIFTLYDGAENDSMLIILSTINVDGGSGRFFKSLFSATTVVSFSRDRVPKQSRFLAIFCKMWSMFLGMKYLNTKVSDLSKNFRASSDL